MDVMRLIYSKHFDWSTPYFKQNNAFKPYLIHVMRLWYFSYSVISFFKHVCAAVQWARCLIFERTLRLLQYFMCEVLYISYYKHLPAITDRNAQFAYGCIFFFFFFFFCSRMQITPLPPTIAFTCPNNLFLCRKQTNKQSWCYIDKHLLFTNLYLAKIFLRNYRK